MPVGASASCRGRETARSREECDERESARGERQVCLSVCASEREEEGRREGRRESTRERSLMCERDAA
eukprot:2640871-Rhodomonas_salina.1